MGTFLLNKPYLEINERCFPRLIFRWENHFQEDEKDSELWNFPIFDSSDSKSLTRYQKILCGCSFGCKNLLISNCLTMKFYNCHHINAHSLTCANAQKQDLRIYTRRSAEHHRHIVKEGVKLGRASDNSHILIEYHWNRDWCKKNRLAQNLAISKKSTISIQSI